MHVTFKKTCNLFPHARDVARCKKPNVIAQFVKGVCQLRRKAEWICPLVTIDSLQADSSDESLWQFAGHENLSRKGVSGAAKSFLSVN